MKGHQVFGLIRTLDPNLWFSGKTLEEHQDLSKELDNFGPNLKIVTGLVVTTVGSKTYTQGPQHLQMLLQHLERPIQIYHNLATEQDEAKRQNILQPLINDIKQKIKAIDSMKLTPQLEKARGYWENALRNLSRPDD
jgi:hypothetical protein